VSQREVIKDQITGVKIEQIANSTAIISSMTNNVTLLDQTLLAQNSQMLTAVVMTKEVNERSSVVGLNTVDEYFVSHQEKNTPTIDIKDKEHNDLFP
jgi:hypothetical protein